MRIHTTQTRNRDKVAITYDEKLREQERADKREERNAFIFILVTMPIIWGMVWIGGIAAGLN